MRTLKEVVVSLYVWIVGPLVLSVWTILLFLVGLCRTGRLFEKMVKGLCRSLVWVSGIRIDTKGIEHIDPQKQYIVMMNHVNLFDGFVFYSRFPGYARGIEEESHFRWPVYGWVIRRVGLIPVSRRSGRKALESLKQAAALIQKKKDFSFIVLPEGTRTITGKLSPFKKGGFLLALEAGLDILPVIQLGSFQIKRKTSWLIKPGRVTLVVEPPVSSHGYTRENIGELMQTVRRAFLRHLEE